jgi:hypothetical protein
MGRLGQKENRFKNNYCRKKIERIEKKTRPSHRASPPQAPQAAAAAAALLFALAEAPLHEIFGYVSRTAISNHTFQRAIIQENRMIFS